MLTVIGSANVALGPVAAPLGRVALGGRNWEGFAVDPYLSGVLTAQTVSGVQDAGVITSLKVRIDTCHLKYVADHTLLCTALHRI